MKIAVNKCYGAFGLSEEAEAAYINRKGLKLFPKRDERYKSFNIRYYYTVPPEEYDAVYARCQKSGNYYECNALLMVAKRHSRNDPDLIAVIEELGKKANGDCADIGITEIPDDVSWEIKEYDGKELIAESHRTW